MVVSPFANYANATLVFSVSSGSLVEDSNGNMRPGVATVTVEALLQQKRDPNRDVQPGVDTSKIWVEGYLVSVDGAGVDNALRLPNSITPDTPCTCTWQGRSGRFYWEFTALNPYLDSLSIDLVNRIRGYFEPSRFNQ